VLLNKKFQASRTTGHDKIDLLCHATGHWALWPLIDSHSTTVTPRGPMKTFPAPRQWRKSLGTGKII